ncbi:MAG: hypothetical protein LBO71_01155, partial [Prevotellaceae bacterium]|nr:hypothetical protein [Prevotellaceae bacterium]
MIKKILQAGYNQVKVEPAGAFLCNFALMLVVYYLCRIFFFWANKSYYPDMTFSHFITLLQGGFQFDISALAYTNSLYLLMQLIPFRFRYKRGYQNAAKWVFVTLNSIAIIANCID